MDSKLETSAVIKYGYLKRYNCSYKDINEFESAKNNGNFYLKNYLDLQRTQTGLKIGTNIYISE